MSAESKETARTTRASESADEHIAYQRGGPYRYYLEDHPFLAPVVTLLLGGLCLFAAGSGMVKDALIGPEANRTQLGYYHMVVSWTVALVLGIMGVALVYLMLSVLSASMRRVRRRPVSCPVCGAKEMKGAQVFPRRHVPNTDWDTVRCPQCDNTWYIRH